MGSQLKPFTCPTRDQPHSARISGVSLENCISGGYEFPPVEQNWARSCPRAFLALKCYDSLPFDRTELQFPGGRLWSFQGTCKCSPSSKLSEVPHPC